LSAADEPGKARIVPLRQQSEAARTAIYETESQLMKAKPTTPAGAAALIAYALMISGTTIPAALH